MSDEISEHPAETTHEFVANQPSATHEVESHLAPAEIPESMEVPDGEDHHAATLQITEPPPSESAFEASAHSETAPLPRPVRTRSTKKAAEPPPPVEVAAPVAETPATEPAAEVPESKKKWYVVKVQSAREDSIKAAIERKMKIEGLEEFYGQIAIPVEEYMEKKKVRVTDKKTGDKVTQERNVVKHRKKFPGYLFAEVEYNDRILYLFREVSGVGDFVGASLHRAPTPMTEREVQAMLTGVIEPGTRGKKTSTVVKLDFEKGDMVRVRDGAFSGMEGVVKVITEPKDPTESPKVTVEVSIFGRPVPVELDYWQVDKA